MMAGRYRAGTAARGRLSHDRLIADCALEVFAI